MVYHEGLEGKRDVVLMCYDFSPRVRTMVSKTLWEIMSASVIQYVGGVIKDT